MAEYSVVGTSVPRVDALEKVTGRVKFCSDVKMQGMLYGKVRRSPHARARIVSIDTAKAEALPGVRAVITGKDVPAKRCGAMRYAFDQYVLARDEVLYIGEGVAAVAADTLEIAERAVELIDVDYAELPAVFDVVEAWGMSPPVILHPDISHYEQATPTVRLEPDRPNVCNHYRVRHGDVAKGFREADLIMENRFTTARMQQVAFEPHTCIASWEVDGSLTVWSGRQGLYGARDGLCRTFDLPPSRVRVDSSFYLGGAFGSKFMFTVEPVAALLARQTGRPVRVALTREEIFASGGSRIPCIIDIKDGVKKDGTLVAREIRILVNVGAYAAGGGAVLTRNSSFGAIGNYRVPNFKFDAYGVYTNEPPVCALRGFASEQPIWAIESHMDMLAEKLGMDPVELRQKNLLKEGDINANGQIVHSIGVSECLSKVAGYLGEKKLEKGYGPWWRGRGLAVGSKYSHSASSSITIVKVLEDGTIEVRFSADELGQGCTTVMAQIAAEEFGVTVDKVKIVWDDTAITPYSTQSLSQGTTFNTGNSTRLACRDAKRQLFEITAAKLGASPDDLETGAGKVFVKSEPSRSITVSALYRRGYVEKFGELLGRALWAYPAAAENLETGQIDPEMARRGLGVAAFYGYAAHGAEVAVNVETGEIRIEKFATATDVGFPINPGMCAQQVDGGAGMGIGSTLWEEMKIDRGNVLNSNLRDYKIPDATSLPANENYQSFLVAAAHKDGPYGAKGMGEVVLTPTAPAIANAVYNAVGVRLKDLPLTREKVLKALKEKEK